MRTPLALTAISLLLFVPSSLTLASSPEIQQRGVKRVTTVPAEYKATSANKHVVSNGIKQPKLGTLRDGAHPSTDPTTRSLHSTSHDHGHLDRIKRSLLALLVGSAVQDPNVSSSSSSAQRRSAMPILALPAEHEHEHKDRVRRGLVAMIIGGAVGDPNVSGAGGRAEPVRREKRQEKRWVWDSRIIQDGDTRTDLPPPGSNVNYFSNSDPASTPSGTPPPPSLSDPFPTTTTPGAAIKPARQSPPPPSPSTTTTTPAEEPHTTAKSRKMWNDPSLQGGKKAAHLVGAASPASKVEPEAQTTSAEGGRSPRFKAAVAVAEQTPAAAAVEEIKVAAPVEEVEEHDPHKFARPSSSSSPIPIPIPTPAAPDAVENQKRYYRGPILQDGVPTEEVPIQGGGAETPTSTPEVPSLTSVEVTGTGTASAEEAVQTQGGESVAEAEAFGQDLLEAIGLAVGEGEGEGEGESSANASEATPAPGVEKRAHHHHHQHARGLTRQGQGHSPRLGLGAAPGAPKMRVKRVYKAREGFEERRMGVKSSE